MKSNSGWLAALLMLAATGAHADLILTLDNSALTGTPGQLLTFYGNLTNNTTDPNGTVFLNGADFPTLDTGLSGDTSPFLNNTPLSMSPGETLPASVAFFKVRITGTPSTTYNGTFEVLGGPDDHTYKSQATANFSVSVVAPAVPEPGLPLLFGSAGLVGLGLYRRRFRRPQSRQ